MRKSAKIITALSVAGLAVAAGSAFTNSNTFASGATKPLTGYATTTVSGATVNSLQYNLNAVGDSIDSATLVLAGDTSTSTVKMNYNGGTSFACGTGTVSGTTTIITTYTCTQTQSTSGLTSTGVVVN
ncbi:hypothetical protein [Arthrobacter sp. Soil762]|uniref:hypothetical protein n=1 Tax=Arthrobacter sp. Soil762 TaxID=1736401 RepID=UPI0006FBC5BF|nr:hypothetical protein [Arthrobacter sp. Soil762]KRE74474.1 hypothetical protein ASG77_07160 [Arthrobacter sp. Soil762]